MCDALLRSTAVGVQTCVAMRPLIQRLSGLVLAVTFTANSVAPGLMHGCGGDQQQPAGATMHGSMPMDGMDMGVPGDASGSTDADHQHHNSHRSGTCDCVGHACCMSVPVVPTRPVLPAVRIVVRDVVIAVVAPAAPVARLKHLLPLAQAPPSLA